MTILNLSSFRKDGQRWLSPYAYTTSRVDLTSDDDLRPQLFGDYQEEDYATRRCQCSRIFRPACIPIALILILIVTLVLIPFWNVGGSENATLRSTCSDKCRVWLVESIPEGLNYPPGSPYGLPTHAVWSDLIRVANKSIDIAAFYFYLSDNGKPYNYTSSQKGYDVYNQLVEAGAKRKIKMRIAENSPSQRMPSVDAELLAKKAGAEVRKLDFTRLLGAGVLHTKLWIVDGKHIYIGSANMDWRSLTQVKEMGAVLYDCPCLAEDMSKIFDVYWALGADGAVVPASWPDALSTNINMETPISVTFNETAVNTYLSSAPPPFCPRGRTSDITAIRNIIGKAEKFVYIAVMDYLPLIMYSKPIKFWADIDNALRTAAIDHSVEVRLLISKWDHTRDYELKFVKSLEDINLTFKKTIVKVKLFEVPSTAEQKKIPYARVNHNKYMVTDKTAYIGTSNWSGDYFIDTAGIGFVVEKTDNSTAPLRDQLQKVFERDWNSPYAKTLGEGTGDLRLFGDEPYSS